MTASIPAKFVLAFATIAVAAVLWQQPLEAQAYCGGYGTGTTDTNAFNRPDGTSGAGFQVNITAVDNIGAITSSSIAAGGTGYKVGDLGKVGTVPGAGFWFSVTAVDGGGAVTGYNLFTILDLSGTSPAAATDTPTDTSNKFNARASAAIQFGLCQPLPSANSCGFPDLGESFQTWMFSRLASTDPTKQQEAINYLRNIQASDVGAMGTDTSKDCTGGVSLSGLLTDLEQFFTNAIRRGDGDAAMIGFITAVYKFGSVLPPDVQNHLVSLVALSPGPGSVETLAFGADPATVCPAICLATGPLVCVACVATVSSLQLTVPETENHRNMIYVSQYLANQKLFENTGNSKFDPSQNGYRALILNRMRDFVRNDFIEYNSHPYEDYSMFPLLSLYSFAADPAVKGAAKMVLDYLSAKVAVSSNDGRRSTPFRRRNEAEHTCDELIQPTCYDPQTGFYTMLAGVTDMLNNVAPPNYSVEYIWPATTNYRIDPIILDLFVNRKDRNFYQFFHYSRNLDLDGFNDSNDELYAGSPSFLLSAGGHSTHYAYTGDIPFPINVLPFAPSHPGSNTDIGVTVPTTLMPTGSLTSRADLIRFFDPSGENMCVAPNFACGLNPVIPLPLNYYKAVDGPTPAPAPATGTWTFLDKSAPLGSYGFYAAVYQQDGFGFLEVYDTFSGSMTYADFKTAVVANNPGPFSLTATNNYKTVGNVPLQFTVDAHIVSINGNPPYDPNRTNGTIINNDGTGVVTISNPALGQSLTLDASAPPNQPQITVPGPLLFPDTCVGSTSTTNLNICNDGNGSDNLFVYNILSLSNTQFQVTEPTSGYPTAIGSNFCFPFQAQFTPTMTGPISAKLTISNSDASVPEFKLPVSGNGVQQAIATLISSGGNFGNVCVGSFTDLNLTINNNGGCDLVVSNITSSTGDFTVAGTVSFPLTIHAGGSLAVPIRFHPTTFGAKSANITVTSNDPVTPSSVVPVSGNAPAPSINATIANNGSFGNVCAGAQADLTLQVTNQSQCSLTISSINSVGGMNFVLPTVTTYPVIVGGNSSVNLPVRFQPAAFGSPNYVTCSNTIAQIASVVIHSNDPNYADPGGFVRSVNGIEGCPQLVLSPQNLTGAFAFPATVSDPTGSLGCHTDRQIALANTGICPLYVTSLVAGPSNTFNVINPTLPLTIAPGATPVPATIRFLPTNLTGQLSNAPDQQAGTLTIVSNDPIGADNGAGLCGEPVAHSGIRVLVANGVGAPVNPLKSLSLASKGLKPNISQSLSAVVPVTAANICGNAITYHLDNETLPPAGTTGNNPLASYTLTAKQGSTQANMSFTLGQCEFKQFVMQIK